MSMIEWVRLFWETPEEQARRRRREFMLRMMEDPDKTIAESLRRGVEDLRRHGDIPDDDLPKAA